MSSPSFPVLPERVVGSEIGAPERIVAPQFLCATDLWERNRHEFRNLASTQRCEPQKTAVIAMINATTTYFGDTHATHTPGHAGRALPRRDEHPAPVTFDAYQNIGGPKGAAGRAGGTPARGDHPRETTANRQRPHSLTDAARIVRAARLRDLLAAIAEWQRASGPDRVWWRRDVLHRLQEFRRLHLVPERRAFREAVAANRSPANAGMALALCLGQGSARSFPRQRGDSPKDSAP